MSALFRKKSLAKLSSPEQLDKLIVINTPLVGLALAGGAFIIIITLIWSVFGRVPITEDGQGILLNTGELSSVYSGQEGVIVKSYVTGGDTVAAGDALYELKTQDAAAVKIISDVSGTIYTTCVSNGCAVKPDTELARVNTGTKEELYAVYYLPVGSGKKVKPGMEMHIYPANVPKEEYGHMTGEVISVANYVTSYADLYTKLGEESLAETFSANGTVVEVVCRIKKDNKAANGFQWSSGKGGTVELSQGMFLGGTVMLDNVAPITMFIPTLKEKLSME